MKPLDKDLIEKPEFSKSDREMTNNLCTPWTRCMKANLQLEAKAIDEYKTYSNDKWLLL